MSVGSPDFDESTRVVPRGGGIFEAQVHPAWRGPLAPNGGHLAAMVLRAARTELARPDLPPRSLSVHFPRPADQGPAQIRVEVLRAGQGSALLRSELYQDDKLRCTALLTCASARAATAPVSATAPDVPAWDAVADFDLSELPRAPEQFHRLQFKRCFGPGPFTEGTEALTGGWMKLRDDDADIDAERLTAFSDLWWPAVFGVADGFVGVPTLELTCHFRTTTPVQGPVLGRFQSRTVAEGYLDEVGELWSSDGTLLAESRQLALLLR
ncbi:MAG: acyl-CoA thioesterase [Candidatus Nanopelagicales bacterium]